MKVLRWFSLIVFVVTVAVGLSVASDEDSTLLQDERVPIPASELHRLLGEGKAKALDQTRTLAAMQAAAPAGQMDMDARYYLLDLRIDEVAEIVYGRVTMRASALVDGFAQPMLDFYSNMIVDTVYENGVLTTSWLHAANILTIDLATPYDTGEEFEVTVVYHGHPVEGGLQSFDFGSRNGVPVICTLSEPYMARTWWPCKDRPDDKADSVDIIVEVNKDFIVSSNGTLVDSVTTGATTTFHWHEQYPITTYLVSLAISNYGHFQSWYSYGENDENRMPVDFYPYPDLRWQAGAAWLETVQMIEFFADTFGEYPFIEEKYGMTHFTWGGAMEHQTNTSATSSWFGFDRYLIAHELAHQWWGDYITCQDWQHIWLNEGFATYCEALYAEHLDGSPALHSYMAGIQYGGGGSIFVVDTSSVSAIFSLRSYDKGGWVLHMLRHHVGDQTFFDILRAYYNDPRFAHGDANTEEFRDVCEAVSGQDLHEFFQDWIYGQYYPKYHYSYVIEPGAPGEYNVFLHVDQYQDVEPLVFDMPIDIGIARASGAVDTVHIYNNLRGQDFTLTIADAAAPTSVLFDPRNWILDAHSAEPYTFHMINYTLPPAAIGLAYADSIIAKGGTAPYTFTVTGGALPDGLELDPGTGRITGAADEYGIFSFTVLAEDAGSYADSREYTLVVVDYVPGDLDQNGSVNPTDVVYLVNHVYRQAPPPLVPNSADVNADCSINPVDVVVLVNYVYRDLGLPAAGCAE